MCPASVIICVTISTAGLLTFHNLPHNILEIILLVLLLCSSRYWISSGSSIQPNGANAQSNFYPLDTTLCQIGFTGGGVCVCLHYPLFNWLDSYLNGSHRDKASFCYDMTSFLYLIYLSSRTKFLKSRNKVNEEIGKFVLQSLPYGTARACKREKRRRKTIVTHISHLC